MDQALFFLVNQTWTSPGLDRLMATLSSFDVWTPLLLVGIVAVTIAGCFKARMMLVVLLVVVGITDGVVVNGLKHAVNRPRPKQVAAVRVIDLKKTKPRFLAVFAPPAVKISTPEHGLIEGRSFPSGHTSDNFAAAAVLALFYRRFGWIYFLVAAAIGYSRLYTGAHWPSDVLFSAFLGTALGGLGVATAQLAWKRWGGRLAPQWSERHPSLLAKIPGETL
jgi:undecaprenyl-diphosphatase